MNHQQALVLSGGGEKGSWQAGVMMALAEDGIDPKHIRGVSVGNLNGAMVAQRTSFLDACKELKELWWHISNDKVYKHHNRLLRWLRVPWKRSVYDANPLRELIKREIDPAAMRSSGRTFGCGYVDMHTGMYHIATQDHPELHEAIFSSASFPVMLSPGKLDGHLCTDGGILHVTPMGSAIRSGAREIIAITLNPDGIAPWENDGTDAAWYMPTIHTQLLRVLDIMIEHVIERDFEETERINRTVRSGVASAGQVEVDLMVVRPEENLPTKSLDFETKVMREMWEAGYEYGRKLTGKEE